MSKLLFAVVCLFVSACSSSVEKGHCVRVNSSSDPVIVRKCIFGNDTCYIHEGISCFSNPQPSLIN